jgi:hypothetical protein
MFTVFGDFRGVLLVHFQKLAKNVNFAFHCEVVLKLWDAIRRNRPGRPAREVLLHRDNDRPHTARATQKRIQECSPGI